MELEELRYPKGEGIHWRSFVMGMMLTDGKFTEEAIAKAMKLCDIAMNMPVWSDGVYTNMARHQLEGMGLVEVEPL